MAGRRNEGCLNGTAKPRRQGTKLVRLLIRTHWRFLRANYQNDPFPSGLKVETISMCSQIPIKTIKNWFRSQRQKDYKSNQLCRVCHRFVVAPLPDLKPCDCEKKIKPISAEEAKAEDERGSENVISSNVEANRDFYHVPEPVVNNKPSVPWRPFTPAFSPCPAQQQIPEAEQQQFPQVHFVPAPALGFARALWETPGPSVGMPAPDVCPHPYVQIPFAPGFPQIPMENVFQYWQQQELQQQQQQFQRLYGFPGFL